MIEPIQFTDSWGDTFPIILYKTYENGFLEIGAAADEGEGFDDYAMITTFVEPLPEGMAVLDTNNAKDFCDALVTSGDAILMGSTRSGYCTYPIASFTCGFLDSLPTHEELADYIESLEG